MDIQERDFVMRLTVMTFLVGLVVVWLSAPAFAVLGDVLREVNLPATVACTSDLNLRTSVAVVQGSKVGFPDKPVLLVTSCWVAPTDSTQNGDTLRSSLFILDPGVPAVGGTTSTATRLTTITTTVAPQKGWGALAFRPDKGDFLGCATGLPPTPHKIYSIAYSGTATFLFNAVAAEGPCDGIAWDPSNQTIYMSPDVSNTIYHYASNPQVNTETGQAIPLATFPTQPLVAPAGYEGPTTCSNSGLAVMGGTLFIGCDGETNLFQLNKDTGVIIRSFTPAASLRTEDLECDPVTFAAMNKDALWSMNGVQGSNTMFAFEIPAGTCGLPTGPAILHPAACLVDDGHGNLIQDLTNTTDTDGDGLLDCWEDGTIWATHAPCPGCPMDGLPGIDFDGDGVRDIVLCVETNGIPGFQPEECADKNIKDLFVEFDTMDQHAINVTALNQVITAFASAPVGNPTPGGPGPSGIRLHIQVDDQSIPHANNLALPPCTTGTPVTGDVNFDTLKATWFGTAAERPSASDNMATLAQKEKTRFAKRMAFRYGLGVHDLVRSTGTTSPSGCAEVLGNDFVVSLGSFPSGPWSTHKNGTTEQYAGTWMHEFGHTLGLRHGGGDNFNCKPNYLSIMSYSRQFPNVMTDRPLNYSDRELPQLDETNLTEAAGIGGALAPVGSKTTYAASTSTTTGTALVASPATGAISWDGNNKTNGTGIQRDINKIGSGTGCDGAGTVLVGFNDWANLAYNLRASFDFADGIHSTADEAPEITAAQERKLYEAADLDGDGVGDAIGGCGGAACVIDIMPGDPSNTVPLFNHNGVPTAVVSVAIVSTVNFDATTVNPSTAKLNATPVAFNPGGKAICSIKNVNGDRLRDLVCTFVLTGVAPGDETGTLEAETFVGKAIRAQDTMHIVPVQ